MENLASNFNFDIGGPSALLPPPSPHQSRSHLKVCDSLPDSRKKSNTPHPILRNQVDERLADFEEFLQLFTDGSINPSTGTSTTYFYIPALGRDHAGKLNIMTSSTTAQLAAMRMALLHLLPRNNFHHVVIITKSHSSLQFLLNDEHRSLFVREVGNAVGHWKMLDSHCFFNGCPPTVLFRVTSERTRLLRPLILTTQRLLSLTASMR